MRVYKKIYGRGGYGEDALRCVLNATENGQGIKVDACAFNVPPKALRRHQDKQAKNPGHSHVGIDWFYGFMKRHPELSICIPQATSLARAVGFTPTMTCTPATTSATTSTSATTCTPQPTQHPQVSSDLAPNVAAEVVLELSPRPRIQEARPRKRKAELATLLTASPYKRFLENKGKN